MSDLRLSLIQGDTLWLDAVANRARYGELIRPLRGQTDLVILPETFTSGFSNDPELAAEDNTGATLPWMAALAAKIDAVITGSVVMREGAQVYNRLIWMRPDGSHDHYDKRHLFRMADEHLRFSGGERRLVVELKGWRVCPLVCYDLRFPVFLRNRYQHKEARFDYDVALFVANWPAPRRGPWRTLLRARAIENLCYVAGVNRVGIDGKQLPYAGDSAVIDYVGEPLIELGSEVQVATTVLSASALAQHRERFPAWMDADAFTLQL